MRQRESEGEKASQKESERELASERKGERETEMKKEREVCRITYVNT